MIKSDILIFVEIDLITSNKCNDKIIIAILIIKKLFENNSVLVCEYLSQHPCVKCGNSDIEVLEFDHIMGKKKKAVSLLIRGYDWVTVKNEIDKCQVLCANCHQKKTNEQFDYFKRKYSLKNMKNDPIEYYIWNPKWSIERKNYLHRRFCCSTLLK